MTADVQIRRILFFLDDLVMALRLFQRVLLGAALFVQDPVPTFVLFPHLRDVLVDRGHRRFLGGQFLPGRATSLSGAEPGARDLRLLLG